MKKIILRIIFILIAIFALFLYIVQPNPLSASLSSREARNFFQIEENEWISETRLVKYKMNEEDIRLCWRFYVKSYNPSNDRYVYIDANTGELIVEINVTD
jgi:predicted small secreted protein